VTRVACGGEPQSSCQFQGVVRALRPAVIPASVSGYVVGQPQANVRAVAILLDGSAPPVCRTLELRGVLTSLPGPPEREGPYPQLGGAPTEEVWITLPPTIALPVAVGDAICGSVRHYALGYDGGYDALIARPGGELLLAWSVSMPREASPVPGWTFAFGPSKEDKGYGEDYRSRRHDMVVSHGKVSARVPYFNGETSILETPDGAFAVRAGGYTTRGPLPVYDAWKTRRGYGFTIARIPPP